VDTPVALLLEEGVAPEAVPSTLATRWVRGQSAHPLRLGDGSVRISAGAFETTAHTALLAASLHEAGRRAVSADRTGGAC